MIPTQKKKKYILCMMNIIYFLAKNRSLSEDSTFGSELENADEIYLPTRIFRTIKY